MWEINNILQIKSFIYSLGLGCIYCVFYDILRVIRFATRPKALVVFLQDIFYFLVISFVTFLFLLSLTNGEIRAYIIFGIALGFIIWYYTISKILLRAFKYIIGRLITIFAWLNNKFERILTGFEKFISKFVVNIEKFFKKVLKKARDLLYTSE